MALALTCQSPAQRPEEAPTCTAAAARLARSTSSSTSPTSLHTPSTYVQCDRAQPGQAGWEVGPTGARGAGSRVRRRTGGWWAGSEHTGRAAHAALAPHAARPPAPGQPAGGVAMLRALLRPGRLGTIPALAAASPACFAPPAAHLHGQVAMDPCMHCLQSCQRCITLRIIAATGLRRLLCRLRVHSGLAGNRRQARLARRRRAACCRRAAAACCCFV